MKNKKILFIKSFLAVLILIFSLQSWAKTDDIREFEIEGMSIGDNLLDHTKTIGVTKEYIKNKNIWYYPNSKKFGLLAFSDRGNYKTYYKVQLTIDPDNYQIFKIGGYIDVLSKNDCVNKQKSIIEDLSKLVPSATKTIEEFSEHPIDKTGESIANGIYLDFQSGDSIDAECYIWGKTIKEDFNYENNLRLSLSTKIIMDFLINEAYE